MSEATPIQLFIDEHPGEESVRDTVLRGLSLDPPSLPPWLFYDEAGSRLFDRITELPEYYLTRTETGILTRHAPEMADRIGGDATIVEFGSGSGLKTTLLLDALKDPRAYIPVDISRAHLLSSASRLSTRYPDLRVLPVCADYNRPMPALGSYLDGGHPTVFFPGSTVGNFTPSEAADFLAMTRSLVGPGGGLLIGFDLRKPADRLIPAYDDAQGVTAEFNRNMLRHVNRSLGPVFDPGQWNHSAVWNDEAGRIEMWLVACEALEVSVEGVTYRFEAGARLLTEFSHKYTRHEIDDLLRSAGFASEMSWTDPENLFAVVYAR